MKKQKKKSAKKEYRHSLYGDIPLIEKVFIGTDGKAFTYTDIDPDFRPKIPEGAVPGDISPQIFCSYYHVPKYFYVDSKKTCLQCNKKFVFKAKEQKYWYETLQFNFHSQTIRCPSCRKKKRTEKRSCNRSARFTN